MLAALTFTIGLLGLALVSYGSWLIYQPVGYIVCGVLLLFWSYMAAKSSAAIKPAEPKEGN